MNQPALVAPRPGDDALERRLARVCGFVDAYLDVVLDDDSDRAAKAACEVALCARHLGMLGVRVDWARAIGARLVPRLRGVGVIQRLVWTPSRAGMLGVGHALLRDLGLPDPAWDRVIDRLTRHALAECRELSPYEALEIDWMLGLLGGAPRPGPRAPTAIERAFDPLAMLSDDAYAFTHAVFYATDFGRRPLPAEAAAVVADRADAGAAWSLARGDYDLIGEFVLAARAAGAPLGPSARLALAALDTTWDELGFVPDHAMAGLAPEPARADLFFAIYHANLVAGLATASLRAAPATDGDERAVSGHERDDLAATLAATMPSARAHAIAAATPAWVAPRATADLRVHQAVHQRDLFAVVRALAATRGLPSSATDAAARIWLTEFGAAIVDLELPGARDLIALTDYATR